MTGATKGEEGSDIARRVPLMLMMAGPNTSLLLRRSASAGSVRGLWAHSSSSSKHLTALPNNTAAPNSNVKTFSSPFASATTSASQDQRDGGSGKAARSRERKGEASAWRKEEGADGTGVEEEEGDEEEEEEEEEASEAGPKMA
jgi:hypothetical protein